MGMQADRGFVVTAVNIKHVQCHCSWASCVYMHLYLHIRRICVFVRAQQFKAIPCCHSVAWKSARECMSFVDLKYGAAV